MVVVEGWDGLCAAAIKINGAAGVRVGVTSGSECCCHTDRAAVCQRTRPGGTAGQVDVVEGRNSLCPAAIEINGAAGDRVSVTAGSERSSDADRAAACQRPSSSGTTGQVAVVLCDNRLRASAGVINCTCGAQRDGSK